MNYSSIEKDVLKISSGYSLTDIEKMVSVIRAFPVSTQLAIGKFDNGVSNFLGLIKQPDQIQIIDNSNSAFETGSITKLFTSTILLNLATEGLLNIHSDIKTSLGFPLHNNHHISYMALSTHTSGLPRLPPGLYWEAMTRNRLNPYKDYDEKRLLNYLQNKLKTRSQFKYRYSNLGAGLLGYVMEKASNLSYEALLQKYVFKPLNMNSSTSVRNSIENHLVSGLNKKGQKTPNWDLAALKAAGAIISTTSDLVKFLSENISSRKDVYTRQRKTRYKISKSLSIALGWNVINNKETDYSNWHMHEGGTGGYRSVIILDENRATGIVILSNVSGLYLFRGDRVTRLGCSLMRNMHR